MEINGLGEATLNIVVLTVMLFGLFTVAVLPGLVIIWVPILVYGLITGFTWASGVLFAVITVLMIIGSLIDNVIMGASARTQGASWWAIGAALVAGILGSFVVPIIGGLIAALLTLYVIEYNRLKNHQKALESTKSMAMGCGWAAVIRFGIGAIMILMWVAWATWL